MCEYRFVVMDKHERIPLRRLCPSQSKENIGRYVTGFHELFQQRHKPIRIGHPKVVRKHLATAQAIECVGNEPRKDLAVPKKPPRGAVQLWEE